MSVNSAILLVVIVAASSVAGAQNRMPALKAERWVNLGATHLANVAWQSGASRHLGVHLHQLDSHRARKECPQIAEDA
jgi:hypothetical protein